VAPGRDRCRTPIGCYNHAGFARHVTMAAATSSSSHPPGLTFVMELRVRVGPPLEVGETARGRRRVVRILGGSFEGPELRGVVLEGGADWQIVRQDGLTELDTRYMLQTEAGELVYIQNPGMRRAAPEVMQRLVAGQQVDPAEVYFRTSPMFETSAPGLQWLTRSLHLGTAERHPDEVIVRVWRVE
jgi:Protein of unknown function (DUF3237)